MEQHGTELDRLRQDIEYIWAFIERDDLRIRRLYELRKFDSVKAIWYAMVDALKVEDLHPDAKRHLVSVLRNSNRTVNNRQ